MRQVRVRWQPEAHRFVAEGTHRDRPIEINAPHEGAPTGFSATELLLAGAGACAAWDVVEILHKARQRIASVEVSVTGAQASRPPYAYTEIDLEFTVHGEGLRRSAVERAVELSCTRYCSVLATVRGVAAVRSRVTIVDEAAAASPPAS